MQQVRLGRTGLQVGVAALGAGGASRLGQARGASFGHSVSLVKAALDEGVTLIDTAQGYGTEPIVGEALKGVRDGVVISTKISMHAGGGDPAGIEGLIHREELRRRLEKSLSALKTDYIDILHLHGVAPDQYPHCRDELVPALQDFRTEGLIRFPAVSERFQQDTGHRMLVEALADDCWDVVMCGYNFLNQTAASSVLPKTMAQDVGTLCMYAVRGTLGNPDHTRKLIAELVASGEIDPADLDDDPLGFLLAPDGAPSLADIAYRFCRHTSGIDVVITGTGDPHHLSDNIRSINGPPLPEEMTTRLRKIFAKVSSRTGDS